MLGDVDKSGTTEERDIGGFERRFNEWGVLTGLIEDDADVFRVGLGDRILDSIDNRCRRIEDSEWWEVKRIIGE